MLILGIDPGTAIVGYGLVQAATAGHLQAFAYGCIRTPAGEKASLRLALIYDQLQEIIKNYRPDIMAIEELFFNKNSRTALAVGQARGVALLAAAHAGLPVAEYTPLEVKQAVAGFGRAPKEQVQRMVQALLGLKSRPDPDDVADALAVAICHASLAPWRQREVGVLQQ
ncbi:Crossover junction endodeoxyribonuclease RuvC [Moorella glycerini]|uniref:Crossover junction endodeoxyribonuclease RuvC n=1 Tax=Neomoorella stamsii TaxID=1266720 RepID=A0A9X7P5K6_9FIRM|nr:MULTISPECIES: crossover junction endodeoxyribonuclease RuvC [Moorella]PRR71598.1 Crossover junction endodeoxyribonuclease RuvC [Moorella stamsii]CEP66155.1 Crossover junction endodeoxyribonuclease RuvC [Moorella glycerini]